MLPLILTLVLADACPAWVEEGSGRFRDGESAAFYGVGRADAIKNAALRQVTAANRARSELARMFETYSGEVASAYYAERRGEGEPYIGALLKGYSAAALGWTHIVDVCDDGVVSVALAKLPLTALLEHLGDAQLPASVLAFSTPARLRELALIGIRPARAEIALLGRPRGAEGQRCHRRVDVRRIEGDVASCFGTALPTSVDVDFACELEGDATLRVGSFDLAGKTRDAVLSVTATQASGCEVSARGALEHEALTLRCPRTPAPVCEMGQVRVLLAESIAGSSGDKIRNSP